MARGSINPTELQIAQLVADGLEDSQIALAIGVTYDAARQRLRRLSQKIGAHNRAQVASWYVRNAEVRS